MLSQVTGKMIRYEEGEMDEQEQIEFFQYLVDTGIVWELQGSYQRTAYYFFTMDLISLPE